MEEQITIRIPVELARALGRHAKLRGVKRSALVREALAGYLAAPRPTAAAASDDTWERVRHYAGSMPLDHDALARDPLARQLYERNWRW